MLKPHLCWAFFLYFVISYVPAQAGARDLTYFHHNSHQINFVTVKNTSPEPQDLWILIYEKKFIEEVHVEIPALSKKTLDLTEFKKQNQEVALLTKSDLLKVLGDWSLRSSTLYQNALPLQSPKKIEITNLSWQAQKIEIQYFNSKNEILFSENFTSQNYMQTQTVNFKSVPLLSYIQVKAQFPLYIHASTNFKPEIDLETPHAKDQIQFLAEYEEGSQFIISLTDPELIARARGEILNPSGLIIFGDLSLNLNGENRNPAISHQPKWSWSLQKVTALEPLAADWCQVYPEMLERMLSVLLEQEKVCFRGSRLLRELTQP
jgi:hypothetical protein